MLLRRDVSSSRRGRGVLAETLSHTVLLALANAVLLINCRTALSELSNVDRRVVIINGHGLLELQGQLLIKLILQLILEGTALRNETKERSVEFLERLTGLHHKGLECPASVMDLVRIRV